MTWAWCSTMKKVLEAFSCEKSPREVWARLTSEAFVGVSVVFLVCEFFSDTCFLTIDFPLRCLNTHRRLVTMSSSNDLPRMKRNTSPSWWVSVLFVWLATVLTEPDRRNVDFIPVFLKRMEQNGCGRPKRPCCSILFYASPRATVECETCLLLKTLLKIRYWLVHTLFLFILFF